MDFALSAEQEQIRAAVLRLCARFTDEYWLTRDREGGFPEEFHAAMAKDRWLGIAMPEEFGGAGLGITEAAIMILRIDDVIASKSAPGSEGPGGPEG